MQTILEYLKRRQKQNYNGYVEPHYSRGECDGIEIMDNGLHFILCLYDINDDTWNEVSDRCRRLGGRLWSEEECKVVEKHLDKINKILTTANGEIVDDKSYWISDNVEGEYHRVYRPGRQELSSGYGDAWDFYGRYIIEL